jgi:hypothetical protein
MSLSPSSRSGAAQDAGAGATHGGGADGGLDSMVC